MKAMMAIATAAALATIGVIEGAAHAQTPQPSASCRTHEASIYFEKNGVELNPFSRQIIARLAADAKSCGRAQVDVYTLADQVHAALDGMDVPLRVAVMGCVVNGPGEAREADLGVASGNGKGQIFVRGEVIKTVPESQIVETLIEEAMKLAAAIEPAQD